VSDATSLLVEDHGAVRMLRLNRPDQLNALDGPLLLALIDAVRAIDGDDSVGCFVITGSPRPDGRPCFCAGDDLKEAAAGNHPPGNPGARLTEMIDQCLTPSIAAIDGICTTGALEVAMACDLRVVADTAQISDWHLKRLGSGLGGWGASTRLARLVGVAQAKDLILTGNVIDGAEALRIGLAQRMYPSVDLTREVLAMAASIAAMNRGGVRQTMAHLSRVEDLSKEEALAFAKQIRQLVPLGERFADSAAAVLQRGRG
jgi:enoyl-CoA hydratase